MSAWEKIYFLQKKLLLREFGWVKVKEWISENSLEFGPELTFVGSKYDNAPIKIALLGVNPYYENGDKKIGGNGTWQWIKKQKGFEKLNSPNDLTEQQYKALQIKYEADVLNWYYVTGYGIHKNYTIPKVVEAVYKFSNIPIADTEDLDSYAIQRIVLFNFYPIEGVGAAGNPLGEYQPYGHLIPFLNLLKPEIVLVFFREVWWHLISPEWIKHYGLTLHPDSNTVAYRRDSQEIWFSIFHFKTRKSLTERFKLLNQISNFIKKVRT